MAAAISSLHEDSREAALARLQEVTDLEAETCLATEAVLDDDTVPCRTNLRVRFAVPDLAAVMTRYNPWNPVEAVMTASGAPSDQRPCQLCEDAQHQEDMILCDRCNDCYHRDCARSSGGSRYTMDPGFVPAAAGTSRCMEPPTLPTTGLSSTICGPDGCQPTRGSPEDSRHSPPLPSP